MSGTLPPLAAPIGALVHDVKELKRPNQAGFKDPLFSPRCLATLHLDIKLSN